MNFDSFLCDGPGWTLFIFGVLLGFALVKGGLAMPEQVRSALGYRNGQLIKSVCMAFGTAVLAVRIWNSAAGYFELDPVTVDAAVRLSLSGMVLCGIGLALTGALPVGIPAALATGRFHILWMAAGVALGMAENSFNEFLLGLGGGLDGLCGFSLNAAQTDSWGFALWAAGGCFVFIALVHYTSPEPGE